MMIDKLKKKIVFSDYDGTIFITEEDMLKNVEAIEIYRIQQIRWKICNCHR